MPTALLKADEGVCVCVFAMCMQERENERGIAISDTQYCFSVLFYIYFSEVHMYVRGGMSLKEERSRWRFSFG